jgi:hypothetical protein
LICQVASAKGPSRLHQGDDLRVIRPDRFDEALEQLTPGPIESAHSMAHGDGP